MITFNDIVNEAVGINSETAFAEEAYADAAFFDIKWNPATESVGSLASKIGNRIGDAVKKIREWIRAMLEKIKTAFAKLTKFKTIAKVKKRTYDAKIAKLKDLDTVDISAFTNKKNELKQIIDSQDDDEDQSRMNEKLASFSEAMEEVTEKFKKVRSNPIESYYEGKINEEIADAAEEDIAVNTAPLMAEKARLAKEMKDIQDMSQLLESTTRSYNGKYKDAETKLRNSSVSSSMVKYEKSDSSAPNSSSAAQELSKGCSIAMHLVESKMELINSIISQGNVGDIYNNNDNEDIA